MKVVCSGLSKTGTKTLAAALRILGYKVYDFEEQYFYLGEEFLRLCDEGWTTDDIRRLYSDADAVTDVPGNLFWEEILKAYPDIKIVHTERVSDESWGESFQNQINVIQTQTLARMTAFFTPSGNKLRRFFYKNLLLTASALPKGIIPYPQSTKQLAMMRYRQHNTYVKNVAPKDQLLVFKLSDGWEPLCKFLGKPVPNEEFPHKNKGGNIADEIVKNSYIFDPIKKEFVFVLSLLCMFLGCLCYYVFYC